MQDTDKNQTKKYDEKNKQDGRSKYKKKLTQQQICIKTKRNGHK
jgi:hypothetical protein